uniref:Uncharacterized protein n=1 Tax=Arundo donax TaxID=35708 RepID=A0A0A8YY25_ARUDO
MCPGFLHPKHTLLVGGAWATLPLLFCGLPPFGLQ